MSCLTLGLISASGAGAAPAQHVLTEEGNVGVTFTQNFNPFNSNSLAGQMSIKSLTYEPLIRDQLPQGQQPIPLAGHELQVDQRWTHHHLYDPLRREVE